MSLPAPNPFSNNPAASFLEILIADPSWDAARDAFNGVVSYPDELEYDDGVYVLVAVSLIAARKTGAKVTPDFCHALMEALGDPPADLLPLAAQAFRIALADQNKLADRFLQGAQRATWAANMEALEAAFSDAIKP